MSATYEVYEDSAGEWRWRLVSRNGNIIADSGEGYETEDGVHDAIDRAKRNAPRADVLEYDRSHFEVFTDQAGEWRWRPPRMGSLRLERISTAPETHTNMTP